MDGAAQHWHFVQAVSEARLCWMLLGTLNMHPLRQEETLLQALDTIVATEKDRRRALQAIADRLQAFGGYRWVGLYDVDYPAGLVKNLVWSGPGAPEHPTFPILRGLTGAAIASGQTVNVGDVGADPRYLTAFSSTQSEIIVPVFDRTGVRVEGTIDVESEKREAFSSEVQVLLESCSQRIRPLWLG
jgi:putative methionine-R-sulfoxide reductase with GAF domain